MRNVFVIFLPITVAFVKTTSTTDEIPTQIGGDIYLYHFFHLLSIAVALIEKMSSANEVSLQIDV